MKNSSTVILKRIVYDDILVDQFCYSSSRSFDITHCISRNILIMQTFKQKILHGVLVYTKLYTPIVLTNTRGDPKKNIVYQTYGCPGCPGCPRCTLNTSVA